MHTLAYMYTYSDSIRVKTQGSGVTVLRGEAQSSVSISPKRQNI